MRHSARAPAPNTLYHPPVVPEARQKAQQPAARDQERYRTAGRVLPRSPRLDPSSLKLRRDKAYLLDCLSRRNAMKPEAATTARPAPDKNRRQAESNTTSRLLRVQRNDRRNASSPESGALSRSRAGFAEESATEAYLRTRLERRRLQGPPRQSENAPCTKKTSVNDCPRRF